ncbi:hypothetical protein FS837_008925 [Tulasnella sp. UAMH 9824]|nr:hypothetical protein FS837_008925 [Tulasnella sp. UAMH 9824]
MSSSTTGAPCPDCLSGYILPGEPSGEMVKAVTSSPEAYLSSKHTKPLQGGQKKAIVLLTDIFGLPLVNCKILADAFNESVGVDVYVPDLFKGGPPITMEQLQPYHKDLPGEKLTWSEKFSFMVKFITFLPAFLPNRPKFANIRAEDFIRGLKEEKGYTDIGAIGYEITLFSPWRYIETDAAATDSYCYGGIIDDARAEQYSPGHVSTYIAATDLVKTAIITHPGRISAQMIEAIKV